MEDIKLKPGPKATALQVLRIFWHGIRSHRLLYMFVIIAVASAGTIQVIIPLYYKKFFDILTAQDKSPETATLLVGVLVSVFIWSFLRWLCYRSGTFIQNTIQAYALARLKQDAFTYLIKHSYGFFSDNFTGSLTQRVNRLARAFDVLVDRFIWDIVPLSVAVVGTIWVLLSTSKLVAVIVMVWVSVFLIFNYLFSVWKVKYDIKSAQMDSRTTGVLSDNITNHNSIQLFTSVNFESDSFRSVTGDQAKANALAWNLAAVVDAVQAAFTILAEFFLLYISVQYWQDGIFTVGTFVLIQIYILGLGDRLWGVSRIIRNIYEAFADAKEMADIMLLPHEIIDVPHAKELVVTKGEIEFKYLTFNFNETRTVLDAISLKIDAGEKVALIGPSGAGKSTFVRLILRLYEPTAGEISIDGQNIQRVTQESLRQNISLVPQDPVLFHRSLKENIRYGRKDATDQEVFRAAKLAHCDEFIKDLPEKYETLVGERGIKLSGGERQRVAIARAILKNAPVLILDEATSSLDSESEHFIQDALDVLMKNKTVIVIAHRLSTIRKMDRIIVISDGKITEEGTHQSLLENNESLYKKLWELQAGGFLKDGTNIEQTLEEK